MTRFRKRPIEIEAVRFTGSNWAELADFARLRQASGLQYPIIGEVYDYLHDTWVGVKAGQWIVRGIKGETYPCDDEVFGQTYELVES